MPEKETWVRIIELSNEVLKLEYSFIVYYPKLVHPLQDQGLKQQLTLMGRDSMHQAVMIARLIEELGGQLQWTLHPFPKQLDPTGLFEAQLEKEKLARWLHRQALELAETPQLKEALRRIAQTEEGHIYLMEAILARLRATPKQPFHLDYGLDLF